jgi:hypothetical protein
MSSRLTLVFVCSDSHLYSDFIDEFRAADFHMLIARNLTHAKSILLTQWASGIVLCHDCSRDDRLLAAPLKTMAPHLPIFLLTDREQPTPADVDCIWRSDLGDGTLTRAMAMFFRHLLNPGAATYKPALVLDGPAPFFVGVGPSGSQ